MFLYADGLIQWTTGEASGGTAAQVGFNAGDGTRFSIVPSSRTDAVINITQSSNVGVPGMWVYQVDEDIRGGGCTEKSSEGVCVFVSIVLYVCVCVSVCACMCVHRLCVYVLASYLFLMEGLYRPGDEAVCVCVCVCVFGRHGSEFYFP